MKTYNLQTNEIEQTTLWDEFVVYLETIYFEGAAELLESKLLAFEFNSYKENFC